MKLQKLYLIRHGETAWSKTGQHTGLTDIPLTEHGVEQAKTLRLELNHFDFARILVSPLKRAYDTCELAGLKAKAEIDADLVEWDYGLYEGLTTTEIHKQNPNWSIFYHGAPEGESIQAICIRADRVLKKISSIQGKIALFSSAHILRVLTARWLLLPPSEGRLFLLDPAALSVLGYEKNTPVIMKWNNKSLT